MEQYTNATGFSPEKKKKSLVKKILLICAVVLLAILAVSVIVLYSKGWLHSTFKAGETAVAILSEGHEEYEIERLDDGAIVFEPDDPVCGFVFYPGGMVQPEAYAPLMDRLAREDMLCIILKAKTGLSILEKKIADGVKERYPDLNEWYIGGHSMGGIAAASYATEHLGLFDGVVLLASYPTEDMKGSGLRLLCIYGSNDGVMNREMYEESKSLMPEDFREVIIQGGCHSFFGDYGVKGGDNEPDITMEEQLNITVKEILNFCRDK